MSQDSDLPPGLAAERDAMNEAAKNDPAAGTDTGRDDPPPFDFTPDDVNIEELANRYQEGDVVETPDSGVGVIAGVVVEDQTAPDDSDLPDIEASPDSPTYVGESGDASISGRSESSGAV